MHWVQYKLPFNDLSQKLKLIEKSKFHHLSIILTNITNSQ